MKKYLIIICVFIGLTACQGSQQADSSQQEATVTEQVQEVKEPQVVIVNSNTTLGKIVANRYVDMSFSSTLPIRQMLVKNGQHVYQGQKIAELDMFILNNTIEQRRRQIEQSELQMQDVIIAQGYDPDKPGSVPAEIIKTAEVKSGYQLAMSQLEAAEHDLKTAVLTAPFEGVVANVKAQANELSQPGQPICRIISTKDMAVEFRVMESDLAKYPIGTGIKVIPSAYKDRQYDAIVSEINPIVDEQGAVTLRARLSQAQDLFNGMNCEILNIDN